MQLPSTADYIPQDNPYEPIPTGNYIAMIVAKQEKTSDAGNYYNVFDFEIVDGPYAGRHVWQKMLLWNPDEVSRNIAMRLLKEIREAVGKKDEEIAENLFNLPMAVRVEIEKPKGDFPARNFIKKALPVNSTAPTTTAATAPAAQSAGGKKPWEK